MGNVRDQRTKEGNSSLKTNGCIKEQRLFHMRGGTKNWANEGEERKRAPGPRRKIMAPRV